MHLNVEIKAKCHNAPACREWLLANGADFKGVDHQTDTYFNVPEGRLKLRQGNIENSLIHYNRNNQAGPKDSHVTMTRLTGNGDELKAVLTNALGVLVAVSKARAIYFIDNVKFHLDKVEQLGSFIEIEAIETSGNFSRDQLFDQCNFYMQQLNIQTEDLMTNSYSDMLLSF